MVFVAVLAGVAILVMSNLLADRKFGRLDLTEEKKYSTTEPFRNIVKRLDGKGFAARAHDTLKRVPKGYDPEHPRADLLRWKGLVVMFPPVPKALTTSPKLVPWLVGTCAMAVPLVEWLVYSTA